MATIEMVGDADVVERANGFHDGQSQSVGFRFFVIRLIETGEKAASV